MIKKSAWAFAWSIVLLISWMSPAKSQSRPPDTSPTQDKDAVTHATVTIRGKSVSYVAKAGTLVLHDEALQPIASVFYVEYTVPQGAPPRARPVGFLFNGGPGSSSAMLAMDSFGPVRIASLGKRFSAPFELVPNSRSLLDRMDLVFIDAIGTGYSRVIGSGVGTAFWGYDEDANAFSRAIQMWLRINGRNNSAKYLIGESYACARIAILARSMTQSGVTLNGLVLANGGLSFSSRDPFYDHDYEMMLPSYAAAAWYHNKLPTRPSDLAAFLAEVETYARGPYLQALAHGMEISDTQKHEVAARLSAYTGLDQEFLLRHNLRVDFVEFRKELLRKEGKSIGQLDTRVTAFAEDVGGETLDGDAATERYAPAFTALARDYLINTLKYQTNLEYLLSNGEAIQAHWDWMRRDSYPDLPWIARNLNEDLEQGVRLNPTMRVLFLESYFDLAGVFFSAADDVAHMQIDPALRGNLKMKFYEAGHAIFTEDAIQAQLRADMDELLDATL